MDTDDPIQQILKNTGWSCEDLLEKLQKYKSQNEKKQEVSVESTSEKSISAKSVSDAAEEILAHNNPEVRLENEDSIKESQNTGAVFSDTNETVEAHVTHSNNINGIINNTAFADSAPDLNKLLENTSPKSKDDVEEQEEITEISVVEIGEDEDDCFEEESSNSILELHDSLKLSSENIQYLETFPRKTIKQTELSEGDIIEDSGSDKKHNQEEVCNSVFEKQNSASEENLQQINLTSTRKLETLTENVKTSEIINNCCREETDKNQPDGKFLDNIVDKGNTADIYERNCEKMLYSTPQTKNSYRNCKTSSSPYSTLENIKHDKFEEESTPADVEDIRNNLKLQLSSLRKRKKCRFLQQLRTKVGDSSECSSKKLDSNNLENITNSHNLDHDGNNETINCVRRSSTVETESDQDHNIYTQTNEFGLVILSVEGGIDLEEHENAGNCHKPIPNATNEDSSNTINSTLDNRMDNFVLQNKMQNDSDAVEDSQVFDEIRRIIRKPKQSFEITDESVNKMLRKQTKLINDFKFFTKSIDNSTNKLIENPNKKNHRLGICHDNSQSSFVNDDTSQTIDKNSPFVSNTLEEFLTENAKLNISYKVPKCGAEEGLTDSYRDESPLLLKKVVTLDKDHEQILKKPKMIKAKTVAQKRKLLEKQRLKDLRRQARIMKQQAEDVVVGHNSDSVKQNKHSYIELNNKKLWVKGTKPNACVARIMSSLEVGPSLEQSHRKKKLSLLTELTRKCSEKIKYLPGPLSKKSTLQINGHDNWTTETKLLPKITLEVTPKVGLCLPPEIVCRLPKCNGVVTEDLAEFALSVLKNKNVNKEKVFKFPMKYTNNQEKIIVKKRKLIPLNCNSAEKKYNEKCINSVVAGVLDDLIRYVEIKELAPTLIKEEETEYNSNDIKLEKMPSMAENISSIIKKPHKKKSKVELELSRLSCKVVNVEVEESSSYESCSKPYCRLGCICKSLKCDGMITYHCQNVGCMLECKCPREKSIEYDTLMLPPGTDILSRDTVTRIEDEAKKDLARVEREFTQMVIHTNDKTIVVGTGGRHKTRRSTKAPTKYSDYIDSNFDSIDEEKAKIVKEKFYYKECFISLERLNLQDIIPYCLIHNVYDCHCRGEYLSSVRSSPEKIVSKPCIPKSASEGKAESNKITFERKYPKNIKISPPKQLKIHKDDLINPNVSIDSQSKPEIKITSTSGRPIRVNKKLKEGITYYKALDFQLTDCARIRGIPVGMKHNRKYSRQIVRKLTKGDFINNITQTETLKAKALAHSFLEVDILKHQLILELETHKTAMRVFVDNTLNTSKHKRKQILEVRNDDLTSKSLFNQDLAIQRRKKSGSIPRRNTIIESVFDGEIIVDERNMELLQKMGNRTVMEGYARLLPWKALINSFNKGDIHIWCMVDQPSRLLINKNDKTPPKNYTDIRQTTQTTEVIMWIKTNKLPNRYHEDHVSFILKQTKDNYEICGLCTKNFNDTNLRNSNNEKEFSVTMDTDKNDVLFKHKDLNGVQQYLCVSKGKFKLQELVEENLAAIGETSIEKNKLYMWAALPEIYHMCKWRMVFLNSDFTFLYFTKVRYSIKYTDLLSASNTAKESNSTVILKNSVICNPYDHSAFGIYFDSHYQDRLFIGPYFKQHKEDDIETLRYINQSLVCTESFNKMQGKTDYKCGHWLIERPYSRLKTTIDLTNDMPQKKGLKRKTNADIPQISKKSKGTHKEVARVIVTQNNELVKVLDSEPKKPEEFNRYIITNIPHLGYLGAFQHDNSSEIDVSWPFENKMLRFPTVSSATNFLQCRFSSLLQPVPESFKISIIVLTDIDLDKTKPIDARILSGHYICGEFGCYNIKTLTNEFCVSKIGATHDELLRLFARRAHMFLKQKIEELADIINIPKGESSRHDIVHILNKAQQNIEKLKRRENNSVFEKDVLTQRKRDLAIKGYCLISTLPEKEKIKEDWKFKQILRKKSILTPQVVVEPIEIPDSDEEKQEASSHNKLQDSVGQKVEHSVPNLSKTVSHDGSFMDQISDLAEITQLSKPDSAKVVSEKQSDLPTSVTADTNPPKKVNKTTVLQYPPQNKLKSILKSNTPAPTTNTSTTTTNASNKSDESGSLPKPQYLTGIKLVKTNEGKLMLVSDDKTDTGTSFKFGSVGGKQLVIKNSQILSVKSISPHKKSNIQTTSVLENSPNVPSGSPKTIVLKKSSLLKNPPVLLSNDKMAIEKSLLKNNKIAEVVLRKNETNNTPDVSIEKEENFKNKVYDNIQDKRPNIFENLLQKANTPNNCSKEDIDGEKINGDIKISASIDSTSNSVSTEAKFLLKPPDIEKNILKDALPSSNTFQDQNETATYKVETNQGDGIAEDKIKSAGVSEITKDTVPELINNTDLDVVENREPSCNNEVNFLVDAVSETFPSKHNHEMSVQDLMNAATLTHTNTAADNNLHGNLLSTDDKEGHKRYSGRIEEKDTLVSTNEKLKNVNTVIDNASKILDLSMKRTTQIDKCNLWPRHSLQENNPREQINLIGTNLKNISIEDNYQDELIESYNRNAYCNNGATVCFNENILQPKSLIKPSFPTVVAENKINENVISDAILHKNDCVGQTTNSFSKIVSPDALLEICGTVIKTECDKVNIEAVKNISVSVSVKISAQKLTASTGIMKKNIRKNTRRILSKKNEIEVIKVSKKRKCRKYNSIKRRSKSPLKKAFFKDKKSSKTIWNRQVNKPSRFVMSSRTLKYDENINGCTYKTNRKTIHHKKHPKISKRKNVPENQITVEADNKWPKESVGNTGTNSEGTDKINIQSGFKFPTQILLNDNTEKVMKKNIYLPSAYGENKHISKPARSLDLPTKVNLDRSNVLQTNTQALNGHLPVTEEYNEQFPLDTNFNDNDSQNKANNILHENAVTKFSPSKRLSNIVVHKLETQNCLSSNEWAEENAKPTTNDEIQRDDIISPLIETTEQIAFNDKKILYLCKNNVTSKVERDVDANQIPVTNCSAMEENTSINQETASEIISTSSSCQPVFKRPIKYVAAKLNTAFTIDRTSFSKKAKKEFIPVRKPRAEVERSPITVASVKRLFKRLEKKDAEHGRIRREIISTNDLISASKIINKEKRQSENITNKIGSVSKTMPKVEDVLNIDKENFMKNATLAEKCINIGKIKKKLNANICEDNGYENSGDAKKS